MEFITDEGSDRSLEVVSFLLTGVDAPFYGEAVATVVTLGRYATVRGVTSDGYTWHVVPGSKESGYAGLRDAQRHMWQRSGLDNNTPAITVAAAEPVLNHAYQG